ncbi:MAG TPA: hypothetical protein VIJ93_10125 [bacterium]
MESLNRIINLLNAIESPTESKIPSSEGLLGSFEQIIDKIVTIQNKATKEEAQAAIQNSEKLSEFEKKIAFFSGQLQQAQTALAALEGPSLTTESPNLNQLISSKKEEVLYWSNKLHEAGLPDSLTNSV